MRLLTAVLVIILATSVMAGDGALDKNMIEKYSKEYTSIARHQVTANAVANTDVKPMVLNRPKLAGLDKLFSFRLDDAGVTNQQSSGRCWLFAGLNTLSPDVMTNLKLGKFEFSEAYLAFWDKMEKANCFLEQMIELRDSSVESRSVQLYVESPFGDGGWWNYAVNLIEKYGAVPISIMPETKQSSSTGTINSLATRKLRMYAVELRKMADDGKNVKKLRERKEEMLSEIYRLLAYHYGEPPTEFSFRYKPKGDSATIQQSETYNPQSFRDEFIGKKLPDYVALMDSPDREYGKAYILEGATNMIDKPYMRVLNLSIDKLKDYSMAALYDSQAVWFTCDVGKDNYSDSALFMPGIYDYEGLFDVDLKMTKADELAFTEGTTNHAMVFMGVDTADGGKPVKWLVENSWGKTRGDDGYWYMYDDWFSQYVYIVIIDKNLLSDEDRAAFEGDAETLPLWSPLARAMR